MRTQVAAIIATAVITTLPAINFSGYLYPAATLEGAGRFIGLRLPVAVVSEHQHRHLHQGAGFVTFRLEYLVLVSFGAGFLVARVMLLRKQER